MEKIRINNKPYRLKNRKSKNNPTKLKKYDFYQMDLSKIIDKNIYFKEKNMQ